MENRHQSDGILKKSTSFPRRIITRTVSFPNLIDSEDEQPVLTKFDLTDEESQDARVEERIMEAIECSLVDQLEHLIPSCKHLKKPHYRLNNKYTLSHWAAIYGKKDVLMFLREIGADLDSVLHHRDNKTPLYFALQHGHSAVVQLLVEHDVNCEHLSCYWDSIVYIATLYRQVDILSFLLPRFKSHVTKQNKFGETPFRRAVLNSDALSCGILLNHNVDFDLELKHCPNLYELIMHMKDASGVVQSMLKAGFPVDSKDLKNRPLLWYAIKQNDDVSVRVLVNNKADILKIEALHLAAEHSSPEICDIILQSGYDVHAVSTQSLRTPLGCAAAAGKSDTLSLLLCRGANPDEPLLVRSYSGLGLPLSLAMSCYSASPLPVLRALLDAGCRVNRRDSYGNTMLSLLCKDSYNRYCAAEMVCLLLRAGADAMYTDTAGNIPLKYLDNRVDAASRAIFVMLTSAMPWQPQELDDESEDDEAVDQTQSGEVCSSDSDDDLHVPVVVKPVRPVRLVAAQLRCLCRRVLLTSLEPAAHRKLHCLAVNDDVMNYLLFHDAESSARLVKGSWLLSGVDGVSGSTSTASSSSTDNVGEDERNSDSSTASLMDGSVVKQHTDLATRGSSSFSTD